MIRGVVLIGLVTTVIGFALGFMAPSPSEISANTVYAMRVNAPSVTRPGWAVEGAADYFAKLHAPPPPPPPAKPPPPPPPPDISTIFRAAVSAVIGTHDGPRLVVANMQSGLRKTMVLKQGDVFLDGWRIGEFDHRHAVLRKAGETRLVQFFGPSELPPPLKQVKR
jgi:hypothetical protein